MAIVDRTWRGTRGAGLLLLAALVLVQCRASDRGPRTEPVGSAALRIEVDATGIPVGITSRRGAAERRWLAEPVELTVSRVGDERAAAVVSTSELTVDGERAVWRMTFAASEPRGMGVTSGFTDRRRRPPQPSPSPS